VKFSFIAAENAHYPVELLCRTLRVSRSSYFAWVQNGKPNAQREPNVAVKKVFEDSRETYGKRRIQAKLQAEGIKMSLKAVAADMKTLGISPKIKRKYKRTTDSNHRLPVAPNRLENGFEALRPNQFWSTDITYIRTDEGWLYLCVFLDLFSRKVIGWKTSDRIDRHLVISALQNSILQRSPAHGVVVHSDRGSQYCSRDFRLACGAAGIDQSMGSKGSAYDNAITETFFASLKKELVYNRPQFKTRLEAEKAIFDYIEIFYNRQRIHSALGYRAPVEYEKVAA
jgi:transposase InsO family protein